MPLLAQFLWTVFGSFVTWLAKFLTQRIAIAVVLTGVATALFIALYLALRSLISGALVSVAGIHPMFSAGIAIVISPHSAALLASYITFWSVVELYKWKVNLLQLWTRTI